MITINTDKRLVNLQSWDDVVTRPNYNGSLDPKQHKLKAIIGRYNERDKVVCGLVSCRTKHNRGYLVSTDDGTETNIGRDCGRTYFGVEFEELERQHLRDFTEQTNREQLTTFAFRCDDIRHQIHQIRGDQGNGDWVYKRCMDLVNPGRGVPTPIVELLKSMVRRRDSVVTRARPATEDEMASRDLSAGGSTRGVPFFVEEPLGSLDGFEALYPENNLRELLTHKITERLKGFEVLDVDTMSYGELQSWVNWANTVDLTIGQARTSSEAGLRLLTSENLRTLGLVLERADDKRTFQEYLHNLSTARRAIRYD